MSHCGRPTSLPSTKASDTPKIAATETHRRAHGGRPWSTLGPHSILPRLGPSKPLHSKPFATVHCCPRTWQPSFRALCKCCCRLPIVCGTAWRMHTATPMDLVQGDLVAVPGFQLPLPLGFDCRYPNLFENRLQSCEPSSPTPF